MTMHTGIYDLFLAVPFFLWYFRLGKVISGLATATAFGIGAYMMMNGAEGFAIIPFLFGFFCIIAFIISDGWWPWPWSLPATTHPDIKDMMPDADEEKILEKLSARDEKEAKLVLSEYADADTRRNIDTLSPEAELKMMSTLGQKEDDKPVPATNVFEKMIDQDVTAEENLLRELADAEDKAAKKP